MCFGPHFSGLNLWVCFQFGPNPNPTLGQTKIRTQKGCVILSHDVVEEIFCFSKCMMCVVWATCDRGVEESDAPFGEAARTDRFMLVQSFILGILDSKVILIPSYLDIQLSVARGYKNGNVAEWKDVTDMFTRAIDIDLLNSYKGSKSRSTGNLFLQKKLHVWVFQTISLGMNRGKTWDGRVVTKWMMIALGNCNLG